MLAEGRQPVYASGECEIDLARQELRIQGSPVPVGGRAFKIIEMLAQSAGQLVTKKELMDRIWPGAIVLENTLYVHTAAVRKALGPYRGLLKTDSGRGYRLLGSWTVRHDPTAAPPSPPRQMRVSREAPASNFPLSATGLVGRSAAMQKLRDLASAHRVVTVTGPGGIGKTALALDVARALLAEFDHGGWLVELAPLSDPALVPSAVAGVLGLNLGGEGISAEAIARAVGEQHLLLLLDNCEHVIDAVANLAEMFVRSCPRTTIMATSREVLRIDGECVYRVSPLDVPVAEDEPDDILGRSAVELFVTRSKEADSEFAPRAEDLRSIAAICRRLDGIPLAIELAAARTSALGIEELVVRLDDRFNLLTRGRRTALARHQTLRATLDWSYGLLVEPERVLLSRLAIFAGPFSLEAAGEVAASPERGAPDVIEALSSLVAKSLVVSEVEGAARYRLLDTTRAYALENLDESGERERIARRHAEFYKDLFERAEREWKARPTAEWIGEYGWRIGNLRAALDWAFSADGDATIGVALTADAVPVWMHLSLVDECRARVEQALSSLASSRDGDARHEMQLHAALGASLVYLRGPTAEVGLAWANALENAERLGDIEYQLRALRGLWAYRLSNGEYRASLALAQRFSSLIANQIFSADLLVGERMIGTSLHYLGDQTNARTHIEGALRHYAAGAPRPQIGRYAYFDQPVTVRAAFSPILWLHQPAIVRATLSRILWLQGFSDQALRHALTSVEEASAVEHVLSLCNALVQGACPVALWVGDLPTAERCIAMLLDYSGRRGLESWHLRGRRYQALLMIKTDPAAGLRLLGATLEELRQSPEHGGPNHAALLGAFAETLGAAGQVAEGLTAIDEALALSEITELHVSMPELLRVKGDLLLLKGESEVMVAERLFRQALDLARQQGALSYELRAAMSLARQRSDQGRPGDALACLQPVYDRFTEGFDTADLKSARALLDTLR